MKCKLVQFSVVVAGKVHNPSVLNPDFLAIRDIVPSHWNWELAEGNFTTPPFAVVRYKQGVAVTVEPQKLQVVDTECVDPPQSKICEIAASYVRTLPHVRYPAVGHNFQAIAQIPDPAEYLRKQFLKPGPWDTEVRPLTALGLRFVYPLPDGRLVLSIDIGESSSTESELDGGDEVVIAGANFHRDCTTYPADAEVESHLQRVPDDWTFFQRLLHEILAIEW
jgi:hypothetical protein